MPVQGQVRFLTSGVYALNTSLPDSQKQFRPSKGILFALEVSATKVYLGFGPTGVGENVDETNGFIINTNGVPVFIPVDMFGSLDQIWATDVQGNEGPLTFVAY